MTADNLVVLRPGLETAHLSSGHQQPHDASLRTGNGNGGGDDMQSRVARLESDVEYIKRDISEIKNDLKSIDSRLAQIEAGTASIKTTLKASGTVISLVFVFCAYVFGSYVSKILDALNGLVLK